MRRLEWPNLSVQVTARVEPLLQDIVEIQNFLFLSKSVEALAAPDFFVMQ